MRAGWGTRLAVKRRVRRASLTIARPTKPAGRVTRPVDNREILAGGRACCLPQIPCYILAFALCLYRVF